jgi:uncharacterized protein YkwD
MNLNIFEIGIISPKILSIIVFIVLGCSEADILSDRLPSPVDMEVLQYNKWNMAEEILERINHHRSVLSIAEIEFNKMSATALAIEHCKYMIKNGSVSHANFSKRNRALSEMGAVKVGENIAFGYTFSSSIIKAWINSPSHKKVLEGNYNHIGIGVVKSSENKTYVTALFYLK